MKKASSTRTLEEEYMSQSSLLSASTNRSEDTFSDKTSASPDQGQPTTKRRNRFTSALKSLRLRNRSQKIYSDEIPREREPSPKPPLKRKNRASNLVRKFSFAGSRKLRKNNPSKPPRSLESSSSTSLTPDKQKRKESLTFNFSETSLIDMDNDDADNVVRNPHAYDSSGSMKKNREIQQVRITISGKKIEKGDDKYIGLPKSDSEYMEPCKPERKFKKLMITKDNADIGPMSSAPSVPRLTSQPETYDTASALRYISEATINLAAMSQSQQIQGIDLSTVTRARSLERGRRYPRPADENRSSDISKKDIFGDDESEKSRPTVDFEVGKTVRTPPSAIAAERMDSVEGIGTYPSKDSYSSLDTNKSSESSELKSEGSRRKITYVAVHSDDLAQNPTAADLATGPASHLSGISELEFDPIIPDDGANMATSTTDKREHLYKILVIGELGTGKTSFIKRYVHQFFSQNYRATIGVDFALKVLNWDQNTIIRLQLWDIAGQERFGNMTRVYYKEAVGAFIVFDVTRSATFDAVVKWKQDLDSKVQLPNGNSIPCILLANKCDQQKQGIVNTPAKMDEYIKENGFAGWFEVSAKENINIEEAAKALVNKILQNDKLIGSTDLVDNDKFGLDSRTKPAKKNCSC